MPRYTVKPLEEGDEYEIDCKADELQDYLKKHNCIKVLTFPKIVSSTGSLLSKTDQGWKDNLARIKAGSGEKMRKPGSKGAPTAKALKDSQTKKA